MDIRAKRANEGRRLVERLHESEVSHSGERDDADEFRCHSSDQVQDATGDSDMSSGVAMKLRPVEPLVVLSGGSISRPKVHLAHPETHVCYSRITSTFRWME